MFEEEVALARRPEIAEAIVLASDALAADLRDQNPQRRALLALSRYVTRAASRSTPFGLFAGYTVGSVGAATSLELPPASAYERRTDFGIEAIARFLAEIDDKRNVPLSGSPGRRDGGTRPAMQNMNSRLAAE